MDAQETEEPIDNSHLLEHWKSTLELRNDQYTTFDKAILAVSGGALALSIANADKLSGGSTTFSLMLLLSWLSFGLSIAANIGSYWTGAQDAEIELRKISRAVTESRSYTWGNLFRTTTVVLNFVALALFCVGIVLLSFHAFTNMEGRNNVSGSSPVSARTVVGAEGNPHP